MGSGGVDRAVNDQDKNDFKSDIDSIKKDLGKIKRSLCRIEKRQSADSKSNLQQFLVGFGFTCVVVGSTFVITTKLDNFYGWGLILIGIVMVLGAVGIIGKRFRGG